MKKRLFAALLLGLLVIGGVLFGKNFSAMAAGGGATKDKAVKVEMDDTLTGKVTSDVTEQWYMFTTEKDSEYWYHFEYLTIEGTSAKVTLYDEDFQSKGTISSVLGAKSEMSFKLTPSATCYLCVQRSNAVNATKETEFKLKTSKALDDGADTMGKANVELISGKKYDFVIENLEDKDYFYFIAGAETSKVSIGNDIPKGILWYVYDENKTELARGTAEQDQTRYTEVKTEIGKKYYVYVTVSFYNLYGTKEMAGNYTVEVDSGSKPDSEIMLTITLKKGSTLQLGAILQPSGTKASKATWKSSKKTVATVSSKGLITAVKKGTATITVTVGELTETIRVTVTE